MHWLLNKLNFEIVHRQIGRRDVSGSLHIVKENRKRDHFRSEIFSTNFMIFSKKTAKTQQK